MSNGNTRLLNLKVPEPTASGFSPDGRLVAVGSLAGFAQVWDTNFFKEVATLSGVLLGVNSSVFSPDGRRLAIGSAGLEAMRLWDVESYEPLITLEGQGTGFESTAFSSDGNVLGSSNWGNLLHLWRAPSWAEIENAEGAAAKP
jgi:WD40 repeat protein